MEMQARICMFCYCFLALTFFTHTCAYRVWKQKEMNIYIIHYVRFVKRNLTVPMN